MPTLLIHFQKAPTIDDTFDDFAGAIDVATNSEAIVNIDRIHTNRGTIDIETDAPLEVAVAIGRIAEQYKVTLLSADELVTAAEIATRTGRSRSSISHLVSGSRGPGEFPTPLNPGARNEVYRWAHVEAWFDDSNTDSAEQIGFIDAALKLRASVATMSPEARATLKTISTDSPFEALVAALG
jgi:predicted DNA-binding transcriptional regulator AlpA